MMYPLRITVATLAFWFLSSTASGFVSLRASGVGRSSSTSARHGTALRYKYQSDAEDYDSVDVERARESLERQVNGVAIIRDGIIAQVESKRLLLTSAGRRFREVEMQLLQSLVDSDAALDQLVHLWTTERDGVAANDMLRMQQHCSDGLIMEEVRLWEITRESPGWAEPFARLATLLYCKGPAYYERASEMAHRCLELKPWHFEALNLLVQIYTAQDNYRAALDWSERAMPALHSDDSSSKDKRRRWVAWALEEALQLWKEAESTTTAIFKNQKPRILEDAWQ